MAKIEIQMQSLGVEVASCCGRTFERGERMSAIIEADGTPMGWYCDRCIKSWKRKMCQSPKP